MTLGTPLRCAVAQPIVIAASLVAILAIGGSSAEASPILLDQHYEPISLSGAVIGASPSLAQTFTVGIPGILVSVDVELAHGVPPGGDIFLSIVDAPGGTPVLSTILATAIIHASQVATTYTFIPVDLSAAMLDVIVGQQLGIHLSTTLIDGRNTYLWRNDSPGAYLGGEGFFRGNSPAGRDFGFRTYVDTELDTTAVPEPGSLSLLILGLVGVARHAANRRTRRET